MEKTRTERLDIWLNDKCEEIEAFAARSKRHETSGNPDRASVCSEIVREEVLKLKGALRSLDLLGIISPAIERARETVKRYAV